MMLKKFILIAVVFVIASSSAGTINAQNIPVSNDDWKTTTTEKEPQGGEHSVVYGLLKAVRVGTHEGYDRIVFEFDGPCLTGYRIQYAVPPFALGESDEDVDVAGKLFLEVMFMPSAAHTLEGEQTIASVKQTPRFPALTEAYQTYDHEGQVIYILGLSAKKEYRVEELSNPTRLVVDIKH